MALIDIKENPNHIPKVGDSFDDVYPWSEGLEKLQFNWVRDLEEAEALNLAMRVPNAILTNGRTVAQASKMPHPHWSWGDRILVVIYETPTHLFAIGVVNRDWELLARRK